MQPRNNSMGKKRLWLKFQLTRNGNLSITQLRCAPRKQRKRDADALFWNDEKVYTWFVSSRLPFEACRPIRHWSNLYWTFQVRFILLCITCYFYLSYGLGSDIKKCDAVFTEAMHSGVELPHMQLIGHSTCLTRRLCGMRWPTTLQHIKASGKKRLCPQISRVYGP